MLTYALHNHVDCYTAGIGDILPTHVVQAHQVHLDRVGIVTRPDMVQDDFADTDALITNVKGCAIGVRTADCVPVLLYDPLNHAAAAIHCGWRGTVQRLSQKAIRLMVQHYGTQVQHLLAVIGPSIGPEAFQVGREVVQQFEEAGFVMSDIAYENGPKTADMASGPHIDLWKANTWLLTEIGVPSSQIEVAGICTYMYHDRYYSARHDGNRKGLRNINVIRLL